MSFSRALSAAKVLLGGNLHKLYKLTITNMAVGVLDLIGVILLGLIGGMAVLGVQSKSLKSSFGGFLSFFNLENLQLQALVGLLGVLVCFLLVLKSLISAYLSQRILIYLSMKSAELSKNLTSRLFSSSPANLRKYSEKEIIYSLTAGVEDLSLRVVAPIAMMFSDISLLVLLSLALLFTQPIVAIATIIYFAFVMYLLQRLTQRRVAMYSREVTTQAIATSELISQTIQGIRELFVKSQQHQVVAEISRRRFGMAERQAQLAFIPSIGKYVMESSLVIGAMALAGAQFLLVDASQALTSIAIFLGAGTRIAPALLRIQQSLSTYRVGSASSERTLHLAQELNKIEVLPTLPSRYSDNHQGFVAEVELTNALVKFENANWQMSHTSLKLQPGDHVAIVGPSGGGKTTLVDLLLGVYEPTEGIVSISNVKPLEAVKKWPGAIAYVPQDSFVINGTLLENIAFGFEIADIPESNILAAVKRANLEDLVRSLPQGLGTIVGETGVKLSGGQRQRLSIARAMLTNPKIIVLDEATSALDMVSEESIANMLSGLPKDVLVIMIAHRLSSVRNANLVLYIEDGAIKERGSFDEVRAMIPEFDYYADVAGLRQSQFQNFLEN
jgi:ABC-type multidrug transport system fused ATPase/permease subunit